MRFLLMRHAKSDWNQPGLADFDRPLNDRGRRSAPRMARWLAEEQIIPTRICCSTAIRAKQTCELLLSTWASMKSDEPEVVWIDELYLAPPKTLMEVAGRYAQLPSVMVIAHNPGLEVLASVLADCDFEMPTAAVVCFEAVEAVNNSATFASTRWELKRSAVPRQFES